MRSALVRYGAVFLAGSAVAVAGGLGLRHVIRDTGGSSEIQLQRAQVRVGAPGPDSRPARGRADPAAGTELLPDLDQEAPTEILVLADDGEYRLAFDSAVSNVGRGPLVVEGTRESAEGKMTVVQLVDRVTGAPRRYRTESLLTYVASPDHAHWHLLPFQRYELRRARDFTHVGSDRKTGFCLGDRFTTSLPTDPRLRPTDPVFTELCGLGQRELTRMREGISVGYGDVYRASLEGQYLDITDVPAGVYLLVHRVNAEGRLREVSRANNAASILLRLSHPRGQPHVDVLAVCPDDERCEASGVG